MKSKLNNHERLKKVSQLLQPTFAAVEPAQGKSVVFVVGASGDGKSTLLNNLLGSDYIPVENDLGNLTAQLSPNSKKEVCKVGTNPQVSETRYPQVLTDERP